ncbi:hypothetical protein CMI37_27190 [Candidatus Pacearchaeota archaeon]|nr:hypothetical protein [Candidatus Pacearchaeota archaeon]|tara:strand:+ start:40 stop:462 length:423 start_codon:yes stop_codon:yes gene_type:complete
MNTKSGELVGAQRFRNHLTLRLNRLVSKNEFENLLYTHQVEPVDRNLPEDRISRRLFKTADMERIVNIALAAEQQNGQPAPEPETPAPELPVLSRSVNYSITKELLFIGDIGKVVMDMNAKIPAGAHVLVSVLEVVNKED